MGIHTTKLDQICKSCGENLVDIHMKSPYIDDYLVGCSNPDCNQYEDLVSHLNSMARSEARRDEEY